MHESHIEANLTFHFQHRHTFSTYIGKLVPCQFCTQLRSSCLRTRAFDLYNLMAIMLACLLLISDCFAIWLCLQCVALSGIQRKLYKKTSYWMLFTVFIMPSSNACVEKLVFLLYLIVMMCIVMYIVSSSRFMKTWANKR